MKLLRQIFSLLVLISAASSFSVFAEDWKLHATFDDYIERVIDTKDCVYLIVPAQKVDPNIAENAVPRLQLFKFDKAGEELKAMNVQNGLTGNMIFYAEYNFDKKYLLVVYDDFNIEIIYDNGRRTLIPGLNLAPITSSKGVNSIFFLPAENRAFLATDFGYVEIDDNKGEVVTSRNYGRKFTSVGVFADHIFLGDEIRGYYARRSDPILSFSDLTPMPALDRPVKFFPLDGSTLVCIGGNPLWSDTYFISGPDAAGNFSAKVFYCNNYLTMENVPGAIVASSRDKIIKITPDGKVTEILRADDDKSLIVGSYDFNNFWFAKGRSGLKSMRYRADQTPAWTITRDYMLPNAASAFVATSIAYHPKYGMLVSNHGIDSNFTGSNISTPSLLCGLKSGLWTNYAPAYRNPDMTKVLVLPNGLAIDPDNTEMVYSGSIFSGLVRQNLSDPTDILHLSSVGASAKDLPGFVELTPVQNIWGVMNSFSAPGFDTDGNLWVVFYNNNSESTGEACELYVWPRADRAASVDAQSCRKPSKIVIPNVAMSNASQIIPLKSASSRGRLILIPNSWNTNFIHINTNGTPTDASDDIRQNIPAVYDQDGAAIATAYVNCVYEDTATGLLWIGHSYGVYVVNPADWEKGNPKVNRLKISRNDGTDLADYLLDGVQVNAIAEDALGRKWFGTSGGGLICTSSDGRTIIAEYTSDSSLLPSDIIYGLAYNPEANSLMISTDKGLAELMLNTAGGASDLELARAYPNPVRPDYYGYVTIDGLTDGALVKIVDTMGNLVKELGFASAGETTWDVTNLDHKRVKSGVYYVLASSGPDDESNFAKVTKLLVIN